MNKLRAVIGIDGRVAMLEFFPDDEKHSELMHMLGYFLTHTFDPDLIKPGLVDIEFEEVKNEYNDFTYLHSKNIVYIKTLEQLLEDK